MRTWQARLGAKLNKISQKLVDNSILLSGTVTDVFRITGNKNSLGDLNSIVVDNIDVVEIIFPAMKDIPMWRFGTGGLSKLSTAAKEIEPFECYAPVSSILSQNDILLKFFEHPTGDEPLILVLQVKDVLGTFGARSIIWQKLHVSYFDEGIPTEIVTWCLQMANRRKVLGW
jgi:hypothetical protein